MKSVHSSAGGLRAGVRLRTLGKIRRPVFILGCPRSGTTFLGEVLEVLPNASYYFEPPALKYYSRLIYEGKTTRARAERFYKRVIHALLFFAPGNGQRLIEKNPKHTWIAESLLSFFPDAQFIVITRDPRDVSISLFEKPWHRRDSLALNKRTPGEYIYGPYPHFYIERERFDEYVATSDLHRCAWIWRRFAEETERLKTALPAESQLHFRYEDLILQREQIIDQMLQFIGETDPLSRERIAVSAAKGHSGSVGRWKRKLQPDQVQIIEKEAGSFLSHFGYQ
jgi:hypothetical protein